MFKRGEESEWSRFSKAFTGKERDDRPDTSPNDDPTLLGAEAGGADLAAVPPTSPAARPPMTDTNLTVARTGGMSLAGSPSAGDDDIESTIGEHTSFDGTFRSDNSIRIRGTAQGEIESARSVYIEAGAKVSAKVSAAAIMVAGEVNGELNCGGRVEIRPSGRVTGTIHAGTLVMQEGAFFDGNLKMKTEQELAPVSNR